MAGMQTPELVVDSDGAVLTVTFNRPNQRNAMTFAMYDGLYDACERADTDENIRVLVLRGAGDKAFVSGTDITQFADFGRGEDGVAYEARITRVVNRLEEVTVPTVAAIRGFCVGAGLALAAACDLRLATRSARFGVPIARTLGNCLSMNTYSLLLFHLGPARTLDLLLRARLLSGEDAHGAGFVSELCAEDELEQALTALVTPLLGHAPLTMWAAKQATVRFRRAGLPDGDDIVARVFGSQDFREAVRAFSTKSPMRWTGR
jgi:enoyl-CoA hydratase/carnithine racemase